MSAATELSFLTVALYVFDFAIKVVALGLVPEGRHPSSAPAWLLLIFFLPVIGVVAFWLIGSPMIFYRYQPGQMNTLGLNDQWFLRGSERGRCSRCEGPTAVRPIRHRSYSRLSNMIKRLAQTAIE